MLKLGDSGLDASRRQRFIASKVSRCACPSWSVPGENKERRADNLDENHEARNHPR
jgi:hypothetical protein